MGMIQELLEFQAENNNHMIMFVGGYHSHKFPRVKSYSSIC